jgi:AcrR family transcriptional regulator
MESTANVVAPTRRPGGRTAEVTDRINAAVTDLLIEGGTRACTFAAVAERAGVERSTLYRRYTDQWAMMIDAFVARAGGEVGPNPTGSLRGDLRSVLRRLVSQLETPLGPAMVSAAAGLRAHSGQDYSRAYFDRRMRQLEPMFEAAVERGELSPDVDREDLFSMLAGPIYFRMFIAARSVETEWIDRLVDSVCAIFCVKA